jgi:hypothetical protein
MTLDRGHGELDDGTVEMLVSDFFFFWILSNFSTSVEVTLICSTKVEMKAVSSSGPSGCLSAKDGL